MTATRPAPVLRSYGRRRGKKLRPRRQALVDDMLPRLRVAPPAGGGELDPAALFGTGGEVWLEVGFGAGEHLVGLARAHPEIGFIGCEPFVNGVAALLSRIDSDGLTNVRIFDDDARLLLPALGEASIGRLFALFPDPWPKARHHKRRLLSAGTLDLLARALADGAELRFASDHMGYVAWTLEHLSRHPDFRWLAGRRRDWSEPPPGWIATRYQEKAEKEGLKPVFLRFERRPRRARSDDGAAAAGMESH